MKVVIFCGGFGTRLREYSETIPKPLVNIGERPIIWHLMKYYAHFGHKDFILCLGYRGDLIKDYFLNYNEWTRTILFVGRRTQNRAFQRRYYRLAHYICRYRIEIKYRPTTKGSRKAPRR